MRIRPILPSRSTVFSRSKICIFSRSDPRFGVTIWSDKVSSISLKFDYSRGKRLSLSIQKEFLKLIDTEQSYSALLAHNFERQFSFGIFITHTDNWPRIPRIGLLRYTAHRLIDLSNNRTKVVAAYEAWNQYFSDWGWPWVCAEIGAKSGCTFRDHYQPSLMVI